MACSSNNFFYLLYVCPGYCVLQGPRNGIEQRAEFEHYRGRKRGRSVRILAPNRPRFYSFKMTTLMDRIVKNVILTRPNLISPELVKNIAHVGQEINRLEQKESPLMTQSKVLKRT